MIAPNVVRRVVNMTMMFQWSFVDISLIVQHYYF